MATYFSILAWRIPWTEEPGSLQSMGLHGVRYDRRDLVRMHTCIYIHSYWEGEEGVFPAFWHTIWLRG